MSASELRSELIMDIISGKLTKESFEKRILELENKFGEDAFTSYSFRKQGTPWTKDYYEELEKQAIAGAGSKEFIVHLYNVKKSVDTNEKIGINNILGGVTKTIKSHPFVVGIAFIVALVMVVIFVKTR